MKKTINLSENDLTRLVQKVINEQSSSSSQDPPICSSNVVSKVKNVIRDENNTDSIIIKTGAALGMQGNAKKYLFITTPDGKTCGCKKSNFFSV